MGWAIRDCRKAKTGGISPLGFLGQDVGSFLECRKPLPLFHLNFFVTSEHLVCCKRAFATDSSIMHLHFKVYTLFLTGEARESVRFLTRQSLCTPKQ
jgi:hypothetical protein